MSNEYINKEPIHPPPNKLGRGLLGCQVKLANYYDFPERGTKDYLEKKKEAAEMLVRKAEGIIPDLSKHIIVQDAATPKTFERYTSIAIYAFDQSIGVKRPYFNWINSGVSNIVFDKIMPWINFWAGWIFIIILILINWRAISNGLRLGLFSSLIYGCLSGTHHAIKYLVDRLRPFMDHEVIVRLPYLSPLPMDPSFPSGTTATVFMIATIASCEI